MDRVDDPSISGEVLLFRRIPPDGGRVTWSENGPVCSSFNFKDRDDELSVYLAAETSPDEVLAGHDGFGLVSFTAQEVRVACAGKVTICRCPDEPAMGHVLICGKLGGGDAKRLQRAAKWVDGRWPARPADDAAPG
jgi:hypothetical protein